MDKMYVIRIVLKSIDMDIADCDAIPIVSINVVNPRRKVTMSTLASISQRKREVIYSGYVELSAIYLSPRYFLCLLDPSPHIYT